MCEEYVNASVLSGQYVQFFVENEQEFLQGIETSYKECL